MQCIGMETRLFSKGLLGDAGAPEVRPDALDGARYHRSYKNTSECGFQELNHTVMGASVGIRRRMAKTPDERRDLLRKAIRDRGLRIARWAKESGVNANSIYNFLNGHSQALDLQTYSKLARTAEIPVWQLSGDSPEPPSPTSIWVSGYVEAGSFREAVEWDASLWYAVDVPVPARFQKLAKALEVRGPSMNLEYREGSVVIWVDVLDSRPPRDNDHVVVYAYRDDDSIEATVKELRVVDGKEWLWPRSSDPKHQSPLDPRSPAQGVVRVEVRGIVIGDYRQRFV